MVVLECLILVAFVIVIVRLRAETKRLEQARREWDDRP